MNDLPITEGSPLVGFLIIAALVASFCLFGWFLIAGLIVAFALFCAFAWFDACDFEPDTDLRIVRLIEQGEWPIDR